MHRFYNDTWDLKVLSILESLVDPRFYYWRVQKCLVVFHFKQSSYSHVEILLVSCFILWITHSSGHVSIVWFWSLHYAAYWRVSCFRPNVWRCHCIFDTVVCARQISHEALLLPFWLLFDSHSVRSLRSLQKLDLIVVITLADCLFRAAISLWMTALVWAT